MKGFQRGPRSPRTHQRGLEKPWTDVNAAQFTADEEEFLRAVLAYRDRYKRRFPALTELLQILKSLGYRKG